MKSRQTVSTEGYGTIKRRGAAAGFDAIAVSGYHLRTLVFSINRVCPSFSLSAAC